MTAPKVSEIMSAMPTILQAYIRHKLFAQDPFNAAPLMLAFVVKNALCKEFLCALNEAGLGNITKEYFSEVQGDWRDD